MGSSGPCFNHIILSASVPPTIVEKPESQTRPRAGTARFMCQAEGVPTPRISWLKNGEDVHLNGRIKMYNRYCWAEKTFCGCFSGQYQLLIFCLLFHSKLVITQIIPEDDAIYQCLAESEQGSVLSLARLIVVMSEDRPSAPRNIHAETISSSAILLAWEKPLYNADKVIAYSIHYMKAEGETKRKKTVERSLEVFISHDDDELWGTKVWNDRNWQLTTISYLTLTCMIGSPWWRPSVVAAESRGQGGLRKATSLK